MKRLYRINEGYSARNKRLSKLTGKSKGHEDAFYKNLRKKIRRSDVVTSQGNYPDGITKGKLKPTPTHVNYGKVEKKAGEAQRTISPVRGAAGRKAAKKGADNRARIKKEMQTEGSMGQKRLGRKFGAQFKQDDHEGSGNTITRIQYKDVKKDDSVKGKLKKRQMERLRSPFAADRLRRIQQNKRFDDNFRVGIKKLRGEMK